MKRLSFYLTSSILLLTLLFAFWGCENTTKIEDYNYQLVWQDEFNTNGAPDAAKWAYDLGAGGWGNNELQSYTNDSSNIKIEDGKLMIIARKNGDFFTSARINTSGLFEQTYGRFEARMKLPYGPGIWPAFWTLGSDIETNPWPECGEIDIMEYRGQQPGLIHGSVHGPGYSGGEAITESYGLVNDRFDNDYHVFAVEWHEDFIDYYVDDYLYQRITREDVEKKGKWVYDHPFFILLNVAVGGDYVGFPTENTPFPQTLYVDYVRVYSTLK